MNNGRGLMKKKLVRHLSQNQKKQRRVWASGLTAADRSRFGADR